MLEKKLLQFDCAVSLQINGVFGRFSLLCIGYERHSYTFRSPFDKNCLIIWWAVPINLHSDELLVIFWERKNRFYSFFQKKIYFIYYLNIFCNLSCAKFVLLWPTFDFNAFASCIKLFFFIFAVCAAFLAGAFFITFDSWAFAVGFFCWLLLAGFWVFLFGCGRFLWAFCWLMFGFCMLVIGFCRLTLGLCKLPLGFGWFAVCFGCFASVFDVLTLVCLCWPAQNAGTVFESEAGWRALGSWRLKLSIFWVGAGSFCWLLSSQPFGNRFRSAGLIIVNLRPAVLSFFFFFLFAFCSCVRPFDVSVVISCGGGSVISFCFTAAAGFFHRMLFDLFPQRLHFTIYCGCYHANIWYQSTKWHRYF